MQPEKLPHKPLRDFMSERQNRAVRNAHEQRNRDCKRNYEPSPYVHAPRFARFVPHKKTLDTLANGTVYEACTADRTSFNRNQARKLDQCCGQVESITMIRDGCIVGGKFCGLRPRALQLGHAGEGTKRKDEPLQVIARFHVLQLMLQRHAEFVRS